MFGKKTITIFVEESVKVGFTEREKGDQHEKERNKYHWEAADDRGFLNPDADITREQLAQIFYNILGAYHTGEDPVTGVIDGSVVVSVPGTVLEDLAIYGDLTVGDGVGEGGLILRNVTIDGRLVLRGGGLGAVVLSDCAAAGGVEYISHPNMVCTLEKT